MQRKNEITFLFRLLEQQQRRRRWRERRRHQRLELLLLRLLAFSFVCIQLQEEERVCGVLIITAFEKKYTSIFLLLCACMSNSPANHLSDTNTNEQKREDLADFYSSYL